MRTFPVFAFIGAVGVATAANAAVVTVGSDLAFSCFKAAEAHGADQDSIEVCSRALAGEAMMPEDRMATHVNRGILHLRRANLVAADKDFDAALALDPNEAEAWLNKAILRVRYGKSVEAMPLVQKALDLNTRRPALAYFVRAVANEDSGNIAAAYRDLQQARKLEPKWKEPIIELQRFQVRQL